MLSRVLCFFYSLLYILRAIRVPWEINQNLRPSSPIYCRDRRGNAVTVSHREQRRARHMELREVSAAATAAATAMPSAEPAVACRATDAAYRPASSAVLLRVAVSTFDSESGVPTEIGVVTFITTATSSAGSERRSARILPKIEPTFDSLWPKQWQGAQALPDTLLPVVERQKLSERAVSL